MWTTYWSWTSAAKIEKHRQASQAIAKQKNHRYVYVYNKYNYNNDRSAAIYELALNVDTSGNTAVGRAGALTAQDGKRLRAQTAKSKTSNVFLRFSHYRTHAYTYVSGCAVVKKSLLAEAIVLTATKYALHTATICAYV